MFKDLFVIVFCNIMFKGRIAHDYWALNEDSNLQTSVDFDNNVL